MSKYAINPTTGKIEVVDGLSSGEVTTIVDNQIITALSPVPKWVKKTKTYKDFATAGLTNNIDLYTLLSGAYIHDVKIIPTTPFAGATIATYTISVGIAGSLLKYAINTNVFTGNTTVSTIHTPLVGMESVTLDTQITANAISTVGLLNAATAGSVDIYLLVSTLP